MGILFREGKQSGPFFVSSISRAISALSLTLLHADGVAERLVVHGPEVLGGDGLEQRRVGGLVLRGPELFALPLSAAASRRGRGRRRRLLLLVVRPPLVSQ